MLNNLYIQIIDKLKADVSELKHLDWYNQQDLRPQEFSGFEQPAVFIEFLPFTTETLGKNRLGRGAQGGDIPFNVRLQTQMSSESRQDAPRRSDALAHMAIADKIFRSLQGFSWEDGTDDTVNAFSSLMRIGYAADHKRSQWIHTIQTFQSWTVTDPAGVDYDLIGKPPLEIITDHLVNGA